MSEVARTSRILPVVLDTLKPPPPGVAQRAFQRAWAKEIGERLDMAKFGFPVVNQADGVNWLVDGQHRVFALLHHGTTPKCSSIDCEVYTGLNTQEMADVFLSRNRSRPVSAFDRFLVAVTAGYPEESEIFAIVSASDLSVKKDKCDGSVSAVGALLRVYRQAGGPVLSRVLRVIRDAYGGTASSFHRVVIEGFALVLVRHRDLDDATLVRVFSADKHGTTGLLRRAQDYRERVGRPQPQCFAAAAVDVYNRSSSRKRQKRVRKWWKEKTA